MIVQEFIAPVLIKFSTLALIKNLCSCYQDLRVAQTVEQVVKHAFKMLYTTALRIMCLKIAILNCIAHAFMHVSMTIYMVLIKTQAI